MTDTATRPPATLLDEPLPEELHPAPPAPPMVEQAYRVLPIDAIKPNPDNPRGEIDLDELEASGLVASIRAVGILQALAVEWPSPTSPYLLLAGHRRLAAARLAGLTEVPCLVRQVASTAAERMKIALVENLMREGLAPLDEAGGYLELQKLGMSQREIAEQVGCSQSHVSKRLALLELPKAVQDQVQAGTLPLEAAGALTRLKDHPVNLKRAAAAGSPLQISQAVEREEKRVAWDAKRSELVEIAEGNNWPVVDEPRDTWAKRSFATLSPWGYKGVELDVDTTKHQAEPCHAIMIPAAAPIHVYEMPSATSICTAPDRHKPKGESTLKAKIVTAPKRPVDKELAKLEAQRSKDEADRKAASTARAAVITKALASYKPKNRLSTEMALTLGLVVDQAVNYDGDVALAAELLGLEAGEDYGCGALERFASSGGLQLQRSALALALAFVEDELRGGWGSFNGAKVRQHYSYLRELGYQPNEFETRKLAEAAEAEDQGDD